MGYLLVALVLRGNGIDERHVSDDGWYDLVIKAASERFDLKILAQEIENMIKVGRYQPRR